ncbi:MAG: protein-ADP-ribose hydrolase [Aerococcus sp.]|nr:protein-ADP-ribose hydrolase [Aerococcus sp.]
MTAIQEQLIDWLQSERQADEGIIPEDMPSDDASQRKMLHGLMNIRPAKPIPAEILDVQNRYLKAFNQNHPRISWTDTEHYTEQLSLWQGDIRLLAVDAIVNAANSQMLGCFIPNHLCIDNVIQTQAGMQMRYDLSQMMAASNQRYEPIGKVKVTNGYNLRARYVFHTVGPRIMKGKVTPLRRDMLRSCYLACLKEADAMQLETLAFCCLSTGEFQFPNDQAADIAINTVRNYLTTTHSRLKVIFNVFKDLDYHLYQERLEKIERGQ